MRFAALVLCTGVIVHAAIAPEKIEHVRGLIRSNKVAEAESAANALVTANSADAETHALLGSVRLAKGDGEAAVKAYEKAVQLAPKSGEYQRQLGDAYGFTAQRASVFSKMSWGRKCRLAYEKAVELEPGNLPARNSLMMFYQMAPAIAGGGMDKAYEQAAAIKKFDATRGRLAYASLCVGEKKFAEAFAELDEILKGSPVNYAALYQVGRVSAVSGDRVDRGMESLQKCLALTVPPATPGHDSVHWRLGNLWEKKGDKKAARAAYEASLKINPNYQFAIDALKKLN